MHHLRPLSGEFADGQSRGGIGRLHSVLSEFDSEVIQGGCCFFARHLVIRTVHVLAE